MLSDSCRATVQASEKAGQALSLFRALGDGTRLKLIERSVRENSVSVISRTNWVRASPGFRFASKVLKDAGVVTDRKGGRWFYYCLNREAFLSMHRLVGNLKPAQRSFHIIRRCE